MPDPSLNNLQISSGGNTRYTRAGTPIQKALLFRAMPIAPTLYMKQFSGSHTKWQWSRLCTCYSTRPAHYLVAGRSFLPSHDHDSWSCTATKLGESPVSLHPWRKGRRIVQCLASPFPGPTNLAGSMMRSSLVVYTGIGQNVLMLPKHQLQYIHLHQRSLTLQCLKLGSGFGDWLQGLKIQNALSKEHELKQDAATSYRTSPPQTITDSIFTKALVCYMLQSSPSRSFSNSWFASFRVEQLKWISFDKMPWAAAISLLSIKTLAQYEGWVQPQIATTKKCSAYRWMNKYTLPSFAYFYLLFTTLS